MTTVLHITPSYKPAYIYGGPIFSVSKLCEELHKTSLAIEVLTTTANGAGELEMETNRPTKVANVSVQFCRRLTKDHTHLSPALMRQLVTLIKKSKSSRNERLIVHIHSWWNTVAISAAIIARFYRIPVVVSPRGMLTPYSMNNRHSLFKIVIHQLLGKAILRNCHIHATTEQEKSDLHKIAVSYKKVHVIPNLPTFRTVHQGQKQLLAADKTLRLLFLSRIDEKKGLDLLFKALSLMKGKWHLTIAGHGKLEYVNYLTRYSIALNIYRSISWIDGIYGTAKFECFRNHDFMILPSHNENFANVVLESLSVGTPVILTRSVGLADYVFKNDLGWLTDREPENIAMTIETAALELNKRNRINKEGPYLIRKDFKEKKLTASYLDMYKNILQHEC